MKGLFYIIGLIFAGLLVAWFGFDIHPQSVYYKTIGLFNSSSDIASQQVSDVKDTGNRFVDVIKNNYNDQDMTKNMKH